MISRTHIKPEVIYLDIDGVLLANDKEPALYAVDFLHFLTANFDVYWLTTHVHNRETIWVQKFLGNLLGVDAMSSIKRIKATREDWRVAKTEAIDITRPFLWLDDDLYPEEQRDLEVLGYIENWIEVNLSKDKHQLKKLMDDFPKAAVPLMDEVERYGGDPEMQPGLRI